MGLALRRRPTVDDALGGRNYILLLLHIIIIAIVCVLWGWTPRR